MYLISFTRKIRDKITDCHCGVSESASHFRPNLIVLSVVDRDGRICEVNCYKLAMPALCLCELPRRGDCIINIQACQLLQTDQTLHTQTMWTEKLSICIWQSRRGIFHVLWWVYFGVLSTDTNVSSEVYWPRLRASCDKIMHARHNSRS